MKEIWKPIKDFENLYLISNYGNIKALPKTFIRKNGRTYVTKEKILNKFLSNKGYYRVTLIKEHKHKHYSIHRLVAETFVPNPNNYPCVNHKDENPKNNCVDNLEWCTQKYNCNYGNRNKKISEKVRNQQKIAQYDLENNFIKLWDSALDIAKYLKKSNSQHITSCCKGKFKQCYGYKWRFRNE